MNSQDNFLTIAQIARILHRSKDSARRLVRKIGFVRDGNRMLCAESEFNKYLKDCYIKGRNKRVPKIGLKSFKEVSITKKTITA